MEILKIFNNLIFGCGMWHYFDFGKIAEDFSHIGADITKYRSAKTIRE